MTMNMTSSNSVNSILQYLREFITNLDSGAELQQSLSIRQTNCALATLP